ncbi:pentapeptide repeat-containing protein [Nostoc sp.]
MGELGGIFWGFNNLEGADLTSANLTDANLSQGHE